METPAQRKWETHRVLNLGSGVSPKENEKEVTLDINSYLRPDVVWDLNKLPLPFKDNEFDRIKMFNVFEHLGDPMATGKPYWKWFFEFWREIWRILVPGGLVQIICPYEQDLVWGDPGHVRPIVPSTFSFLSQKAYLMNHENNTAMTHYNLDFDFDFVTPPSFTVDKKFIVALLMANKEATKMFHTLEDIPKKIRSLCHVCKNFRKDKNGWYCGVFDEVIHDVNNTTKCSIYKRVIFYKLLWRWLFMPKAVKQSRGVEK